MDQLPLSFGSKKKKKNTTTTIQRTAAESQRNVTAYTADSITAENNNDDGETAAAAASDVVQLMVPPKSTTHVHAERGPAKEEEDDDKDEADADADDDADDDDDEDLGEFPIENVAVLKGHEKTVSALAIDPSGSRVLTGSHDYSIKFWDFGGMDRSLQSFRSVMPEDGYPVCQIDFSTTGDRFASAMDSSQPRIYDRDGFHLATMIKGDVYINDMKNTKGHVSAVKAIQWNPKERNQIMTASSDSTIRMWDVGTCEKRYLWLARARNSRGTKTAITSCAFDTPGEKIVAGCLDGSLQVFDTRQHNRPQTVVRQAHDNQHEITGIAFSRDERTLVSRSTDNTLKVWDIRNAQEPLKAFSNLSNRYSQTDCIFSPDDEYILTGVSSNRGKDSSVENSIDNGYLMFIEKQTLQTVQTVVPNPSDTAQNRDMSVIRAKWHPTLNQIFVGCSDGNTYIYYDSKLSTKGVLLSMARAPRKKAIDSVSMAAPVIVVPLDEKRKKRQQLKQQRMEKLKHHVPTKSAEQETGGGPTIRLGSEQYSHLMMRSIKKQEIDTDPRAALLKYDEEVKRNPYFVSPAYQGSHSQSEESPRYDADELEDKEHVEEENIQARFGRARSSENEGESSSKKRQKR